MKSLHVITSCLARPVAIWIVYYDSDPKMKGV